MVARKKEEPEAQEPQGPVAFDEQGNPLAEKPEEPERSGPLVDVTEQDLVDPRTGKPAPVSATTQNLQATLSNTNGRVLVKVAVKGYIGEEPVVVLAEHAGEFAELVDGLAEAASEQKAAFAKHQDDEA